MKRSVMVLLLTAIVSSASARMLPMGHFHRGFDRGLGHRPAVVVRGGFYNPWYAHYGFYYNYPYYYGYNNPSAPPTQLDIQVAQIKNNYADKISSVKLDNSLNGPEKRAEIRALKRDRNLDVMQAKKDYYKS